MVRTSVAAAVTGERLEMAASRVSEKVLATGQAFVLCESSSLALDFIRGAASQVVVVGHGLILFGLANMPYLQNAGVVVFFLMSGFIIPYSSFMKARKDSAYGFGSYFIDRFSRIYVGFVPGLVCVLLLDIFSQPESTRIRMLSTSGRLLATC